MLIKFVEIANFRKLKSCRIDFADQSTVFVGANNSGKTTAIDALRIFLKDYSFSTREFTLSNWKEINAIGQEWISLQEGQLPDLSISRWEKVLPQLDVWLSVVPSELQYVSHLIPTLDWNGGEIGVRLRFEPKDFQELYKEFITTYNDARTLTSQIPTPKGNTKKNALKLWPNKLWEFLDRRLNAHFKVAAYLLDPAALEDPVDGFAKPQQLQENSIALDRDPFAGLIKIDIINAQRGFSNTSDGADDEDGISKNSKTLTSQFKEYYTKHLDPEQKPVIEDLEALEAMEQAKVMYDARLMKSFSASLDELEGLNYPGFGGNPKIKISTKVNPIDGLNHNSAVQFELYKAEKPDDDHPLSLPEKYNGLGYQNLISMVFKLIRFRDDWMRVGKVSNGENDGLEFEPLHLVLVEEPEAHLHAQVQQVFIKKAYNVLQTNVILEKYKQFKTQLIVSTHSNHVAHEIPFTSLRYFKREKLEEYKAPVSTVVNLSRTFGSEKDTTKFAVRYLKTTHCDLFFADAVILVEGQAERMLIPHFIKREYKDLDGCYISILEIGGSHAFTLKPLLQDLGIRTLIITDIDSVNPAKNNTKEFPEKGKHYVTGNSTLTKWLPGKSDLDELLAAGAETKISVDYPFRVAYQTPIEAKFKLDPNAEEILPYTFEIALAFKNAELFESLDSKGLLKKFCEACKLGKALDANKAMYEALKTTNKKAEFALELLFSADPESLKAPDYIAEGLLWLHNHLIEKPKMN